MSRPDWRDQPLTDLSGISVLDTTSTSVLDATASGTPARSHETIAVLARGSRLGDLLRLYRVRQWMHILPLPLASFDTSVPLATALLAAACGVANLFAILAFGFLVNAISDRHVDRDARKNPLVIPGRNNYKLSLIALPAVSVALAAFSPWPVQLATASCLAVGCLYSVGPRLKTIPVVGTLANAAWYVPMLFLGMTGPSLPAGFGTIAIAFTALLLQNQLIHESGDRLEDEASGIRTTWLAFGPRWTAFLAACAGAVALVMTASAVGEFRYVVGSVFVVAFPLLLAWDGLSADRAARLRVVHRWCAVLFGASLYGVWRGWV